LAMAFGCTGAKADADPRRAKELMRESFMVI